MKTFATYYQLMRYCIGIASNSAVSHRYCMRLASVLHRYCIPLEGVVLHIAYTQEAGPLRERSPLPSLGPSRKYLRRP